jgi:hypothetical protein
MNGQFLPKWFMRDAGVVATVLEPFSSLPGYYIHQRIDPVCAILRQHVYFA